MSRRRRDASAFSLFAFQDIITSVTGIMILVTLILSLELIQKIETSPASRTQQIVQQMQSTVAMAEQTQARIFDIQTRLSAGADEMDEVAAVNLKGLEDESANLQDVNTMIADELAQLSAQLASVNRERQDLEKTAEDRKADTQRIAEMLEEVEKKKEELEAIKKSNRVIFNPTAGDAKTPWLVEITDTSIMAAKAGVAARPTKLNGVAELRTWAGNRDPGSEYFVLLVKPGGTENFHRAKALLKTMRFDIGFDLLSKDQVAIDPERGAGTGEP